MPLREFDPEHCLLLACALAPAGTDLSGAFAHLPGEAPSGERLLAGAALHRILPQLAAQVPRSNAVVAQAIGVRLEAATRANHGRGLFMTVELARALDALRAAGIPAVPFKGPAFASLLGDGPGAREMDDLDLLVRPSDVGKAAQTLAPLGYAATLPPQALASPWLTRVACELGLSAHRDEALIELHWRASPHWFPAPCTLDDVMERSSERDIFGCRMLWPAPEQLLLVHVSDGMKSLGCGMRWIGDVARILRHHPSLDWAHVRKVATRSGGLGSVRVALATANELAGEVAQRLDVPALALVLPSPAQTLADEAKRDSRLANAVRSIRMRLQSADWSSGPMPHFAWALSVADHPAHVALEIARYLAGPSVADLVTMPERGESDLALRLRALRRRFGRGRETPTPAQAGL